MKDSKNGSNSTTENPECFIVMPFRNVPPYPEGHFQRVYDDIIAPACVDAGLNPIKANDVAETNLIHLDILRRLLNSEIVLCDLSSQNPNVFFELGLRQAFDKPVTIVQDELTERAFDTNLLRATPYRSKRLYNEVLEDQRAITKALKETRTQKPGNINSIVRLLGLTEAQIPEPRNLDDSTQIILSHLLDLRAQVGEIRTNQSVSHSMPSNAAAFLRESEMKALNRQLLRELEATELEIDHIATSGEASSNRERKLKKQVEELNWKIKGIPPSSLY